MKYPETRWPARPSTDRLCDGLLALGLLTSGAVLVAFSNGLYFLGDSWDFLLTRGTIDGADRGLFVPHNEHWSTLPILVFRAMSAVFGLEHFLPYALLMIVTHMALCVLLYVVLTTVGCDRWPALLATLLLAFFGGGYENTMWEFQITFVGPLVFGMGAIAVWHRWADSILGNVAVNALLILGLMSSGTGIGAVILVTSYVTFTHGARAAVAVGAAPTVIYLAWYAVYGAGAATGVNDVWVLLNVPSYVWTAFTSGIERATAIPGSGGPLLIILLAAPFVVRDIPPRLRALACAGVIAALAQTVLTGLARVELGVEQAGSSRYAYLILALLVPAIAVALTGVRRAATVPGLMTFVIVGLVSALYVVNGMAAQHTFRNIRISASGDLERLMASIQAAVPNGGPVLTEVPFSASNPDITVSLLDTPEARGMLSGERVTSTDKLDGESIVYVGVGTDSFGLDPAASIETSPELPSTQEGSTGCRTLVAPEGGVSLRFGSPASGAEFTVTSPASVVTTSLERDGLRSIETPHPIVAGTPVVVAVHASDAELNAAFNAAGDYAICAAARVVG